MDRTVSDLAYITLGRFRQIFDQPITAKLVAFDGVICISTFKRLA